MPETHTTPSFVLLTAQAQFFGDAIKTALFNAIKTIPGLPVDQVEQAFADIDPLRIFDQVAVENEYRRDGLSSDIQERLSQLASGRPSKG